MGSSSSKHYFSSGTLVGATAPPLQALPPPLRRSRKHRVVAKRKYKAGESVKVEIEGETIHVDAPKRLKKGQTFVYVSSDIDKVIASTLPRVPGMKIVQAKPIIWGSVSFDYSYSEEEMGKMTGRLMLEAQAQLLEQAVRSECNAVLAITFNITTNTSGFDGSIKMCVVTACGTPCSVVPMSQGADHQAVAIHPIPPPATAPIES
jgi:uncharacterized protein YbjQ (UPF0145 family)